MVAIPLAPVVERDDEEIASLEIFQNALPVALARERIAQWSAESVDDRGFQKEAPDAFGLRTQHLFDEIVGDVAVTAGECVDAPANVAAPLHGERRQLEPRDPTLGSLLELCG